MLLSKNLKVKFLGITPLLKDKSGILNPQEIVALSALLTFKGKSIKKLFKGIEEKGQKLSERIKKILLRSSLRGHASIATTPSLCLTYEGSKFLDSILTGTYFSSSLMSSGRRTETTTKDIIYPDSIFLNKKARAIYQQTSERIIKFFNFLLTSERQRRGEKRIYSLCPQKIKKDEASKILQYGIYGTGIVQLPIETIIGLKKEYLKEKKWIPEELGILLKKIEKEVKKLGIDWLYPTREAAPRNIYPYPNIFKDPAEVNLTRELKEKMNLGDESKNSSSPFAKARVKEGSRVISVDVLMTAGLKKKLLRLTKEKKDTFCSLEKIKKNWQKLLFLYQSIFRDYNSAVRIKVFSSVPWRIWGEKKRHRTCPQIVESIYYCIERTKKVFLSFKKQIKQGRITKNALRKIERVFSIPPSVKQNRELFSEYLRVGLEAMESYQKLMKLNIKPRDAIFIIPRAVKIDILQEYDLYNLLTGYYPLRLCQTAEEEMRRNTIKEVSQIKDILVRKGYNFLARLIVPKCHLMGFCPEEESCPMILSQVPNYNEKFHKEMKQDLENKFQQNLKKLGKKL